MTQGDYDHTISGLLRKRAELMGESQTLREELAVIGNDIEAIDRILDLLGYQGELSGKSPRSARVVFFARNELRRFVLSELRKAEGTVSSRSLAETIINLERKDSRDRKLVYDMVRRVGKCLKLLREHGIAVSYRGSTGEMVWKLKPDGFEST